MKMKRSVIGLLVCALAITIGTLGYGNTVNAETMYANNEQFYEKDNGVIMWRLYNRNTGEHFYTSEMYEAKSLNKAGWLIENAGFIAVNTGIPVYRLYSQYSGDHHYTSDSNERDQLLSIGWSDEGVGWYTQSQGEGFPVYRLYNPNATTATHHYTLDEGEKNVLISLGWQDEGVAFQSLHDIYTMPIGTYIANGKWGLSIKETSEPYVEPTCSTTGMWGDIGFRDMPGYYYSGWGSTGFDIYNHSDYGMIDGWASDWDEGVMAPMSEAWKRERGLTGHVYKCKGCGKYLIERLDGTWYQSDELDFAYSYMPS